MKRLEIILNRLTIAAFLLAIWAPLLGMPFDLGARAPSERPPSTPYPEMSASFASVVGYPLRFESWFTERFGFRNTLTRLHSRLLVHVFHTSPSAKVVVGREGWLFYNGDPQVRDPSPLEAWRAAEPLSPLRLEQIRWMLEDQNDWLAERGIRYLYVLVPSKEEIYSEYLPGHATRIGAKNARIQLTEHLRAHSKVPFLDLTEVLLAAKREANVYDRIDSHWNELGAYLGYRAMADKLSEMFPAIRPEPDSGFSRETRMRSDGDLVRMISLEEDLAEPSTVVVRRAPARANPHPVDAAELSDWVASTGDTNLPRAVVYRDSFANRLIPYLSEQFSDVRYIWARDGARMAGVEAGRPDVVIQIMTDRALQLNLRYSPAIQSEATLHRFERSTNVLWSGRFDAQIPEGGEPCLDLPDLPGRTWLVPIVQARVVAPGPGTLALSWPSSVGSQEVREPLVAGTNALLYNVIEPGINGPFRFCVSGAAGEYRVDSIEIRGVPR